MTHDILPGQTAVGKVKSRDKLIEMVLRTLAKAPLVIERPEDEGNDEVLVAGIGELTID